MMSFISHISNSNINNKKIKPLISVIIPNYNHALFLKQRIESVLNQSFKNFELIILDDYSTDSSREIIEQYRNHPKVKHIIYNEDNSGSTFKQWNKGVKLATGDYIWISESDDYAHCEFLNTCLNKLLDNPSVDLVYTDSLEVNENNEELRRWSRWQEYLDNNLWRSDFLANGQELNSTYNYLANVIPNASCVVFKKEAYKNSPFIKEIEILKFTGDWRMWFSMLQVSNVYYCHQPLNYFRYHDSTTRSSINLRIANLIEQFSTIYKLKQLVKKSPDKNLEEKKFSELYELWNPSVKRLLSTENIRIFRLALLTDPKILFRVLKTVYKRLYAV